jgi:hypothetical protein
MLGISVKAAPATKPDEKPMVEDKKEEDFDDDDDKDPMQQLEDEMDKEDIDIFGIEDVSDMKDGAGTPLFAQFQFEDWALLSLRFELHLLVHAFRHDANDEERYGVPPEHLAFYYNKYYKKGLNPKNYGVDSVDELIELVRDAVIQGGRSKVVESMVNDDLESNDIFVKLTEEARRERQRRIDAGEEGAQLKFSRPAATAAGGLSKAKSGAPDIVGSNPQPAGFSKAPSMSSIAKADNSIAPGIVVRPQTPGALTQGALQPGFQRPKGGWGSGFQAGGSPPQPVGPRGSTTLIRPSGMSQMFQQAAKFMAKGTAKSAPWRPQAAGPVANSGGWRGGWRG